MDKKTSDWEKDFDRTFAWMNSPLYLGKVKAFISDLLAKEKMELVERIEKEIEKFYIDSSVYPIDSESSQWAECRNNVLDRVTDVLSALKEEKEVGG